MRETELRAHRRNTEAFIAANPVTLVLTPRTREKTASGARFVEGTPRNPQILRLIDQSSAGGPTPGATDAADGQQRAYEYQLLGKHDATIGLYDIWFIDGIRYEVAEVLPYNGYERRAQVVRYAD